MATLNAAQQKMIDKLNDGLVNGTLTPDDMAVISKAIAYLQSHTTWERALIAVAEEHLNTGTTALAAAQALLEAAKVTLDSSVLALNEQATNLALLPDILARIVNGNNHFMVSATAVDALLGAYYTGSQIIRTHWSLSLDDVETGVYTSLSASNDVSGGGTANQYLQLDKFGTVTSAITSLSITAGSAALLPSTEGSVRLFNIPTGGTSCIVYHPGANVQMYSFSITGGRLYLDPATRKVYALNAGKLIESTATGAAEVVPAVAIADVAALDAYALSREWVRVDTLFGSVSNQGLQYMPFSGADNLIAGSELAGYVGAFTGAAACSFLSFEPSAPASRRIERITPPNPVPVHARIDTTATTNYNTVRSLLMRCRFRVGSRMFRDLDIEVRPRQDSQSNSRGNAAYSPSVLGVSLLHNAVIVRAGFQEAGSGGYTMFTGLVFGR